MSDSQVKRASKADAIGASRMTTHRTENTMRTAFDSLYTAQTRKKKRSEVADPDTHQKTYLMMSIGAVTAETVSEKPLKFSRHSQIQ